MPSNIKVMLVDDNPMVLEMLRQALANFSTVQPMTDQYINPTRQFADLVLKGDDPVKKSAAAVLDFIEKANRGCKQDKNG